MHKQQQAFWLAGSTRQPACQQGLSEMNELKSPAITTSAACTMAQTGEHTFRCQLRARSHRHNPWQQQRLHHSTGQNSPSACTRLCRLVAAQVQLQALQRALQLAHAVVGPVGRALEVQVGHPERLQFQQRLATEAGGTQRGEPPGDPSARVKARTAAAQLQPSAGGRSFCRTRRRQPTLSGAPSAPGRRSSSPTSSARLRSSCHTSRSLAAR